MDTKTWAMTTARVEKETLMPAASREGPSTPRRPRVDSRAMPATTGGMVMGRTAMTRPTRTPGQSRASSRARGTPRPTEIAVAIRQVRRDRSRAARAEVEASSVGSSFQATRVPSPTKGRTMAQAPRTARRSTGGGSGLRAARERRRADRRAGCGAAGLPAGCGADGPAGGGSWRVIVEGLSRDVGRRPRTPAHGSRIGQLFWVAGSVPVSAAVCAGAGVPVSAGVPVAAGVAAGVAVVPEAAPGAPKP